MITDANKARESLKQAESEGFSLNPFKGAGQWFADSFGDIAFVIVGIGLIILALATTDTAKRVIAGATP